MPDLAPRPASSPVDRLNADFDPKGLGAVERLVEGAVAAQAFPGAVLVVRRGGQEVVARPFGRLTYSTDSPRVTLNTAYDLASLTKVVVTTTLAMQLVEAGQLDLESSVASHLPEFAQGDSAKAEVTVLDLLAHTSGLPPVFPGHFPAYAAATGLPIDRCRIVEAALRIPLEAPPRTRVAYSDLGVIAFGAIVERLCGARLDSLAASRITLPLGLSRTRYLPPREEWPLIAPTEDDPWRGRVIQGEVHDECAWAMGGVSAHAGLFGSARDLADFGQALLDGGILRGVRLVGDEVLGLFTTRDPRMPATDRAIGWQIASPDNSAGPDLSPRAYGHTGFTGTSLWIDPDRRLVVAFLTNRVYPRRENTAILSFRPMLHSAIVRSIRA